MRAAVGVARPRTNNRLAQDLHGAVGRRANDPLVPGPDNAPQFGDPRLHDDLVVGQGRTAVLHREVRHHDLRTQVGKRGEGATDRCHGLAASGFKPRDVDRMIDVVVRIKFAEADFHGKSVRGHQPRLYAAKSSLRRRTAGAASSFRRDPTKVPRESTDLSSNG